MTITAAQGPAADLLAELEGLGVVLWEEDGKLRYRAPRGVLTEERLGRLRECKEDVLAALKTADALPEVRPGPAARHEPFPLTDVQAAYLLGSRSSFAYGGVGCHGYGEVSYPTLDPGRLRTAVAELVARHDMLRAVVDAEGSQRVLPDPGVPEVEVRDLRGLPAREAAEELARIRSGWEHREYDPGTWPLFGFGLTLLDESALLHVSLNFLIADFVSIQVLLAELDQLYTDPAGAPPPPELTFRDYLEAERRMRTGPAFERARDYWMSRVDDLAPGPALPVLGSGRATEGGVRFERHAVRIEPGAWAALCDRARRHGVSPSGAVLAAFAEVIGRWSRTARFTLDLTLLNREPLHPDVGRLVGDFTGIELLEVDTAAGGCLAERAKAHQEQLWRDLEHRRYSGIEVMREIGRRRGPDAALFPVVYTSAIGLGDGEHAGADEGGEFVRGLSQTPQVWIDCQNVERRGGLDTNWDVRAGVLPSGMVDDMFAAYAGLLSRMADGDEAWTQPFPVALPGEQRERRAALNATEADLPLTTLGAGVLAQARRSPDRPAVITGNTQVTYGELLGRADAVAGALREGGVRRGDLVGVVLDKGADQVSAVLGVLLAGAAYVPVETSQPVARRDGILRDAGVRAVVTTSSVAEPPADLVVCVERLGAGPVSVAEVADPPSDLDEVAYVIHTSGSTGKPKGVVVSHRSAANTVADLLARYRIGGDDRVLGLASLGFDLSVFDVFGLLSVGGALVLPDPHRRADPSHWAELVCDAGVTVWNSVPAQMQMLTDYLSFASDSFPARLRLVLLSGDWVPLPLPDRIRDLLPGAHVVALGGATEVSIWSIAHDVVERPVPADWTSVPYGRPLANQTVHVVDERMLECPDGVPGEIVFGGVGVAEGYLHDPERTRDRFVTCPHTGQRRYRTGDSGRYLPNGEVEFLGRTDAQVKIRGHRIELAEVEAGIVAAPSVSSVAVVAHGSQPLERSLVAFVVPEGGEGTAAELDVEALLDDVATRLPEHMLPARVEVLGALPQTANGKVDRAALERRLAPRRASGEAPAGAWESAIAACWADVLGCAEVGRDQDFFFLGGDSLLAARLAGRLREELSDGELEFDEVLRALLEGATVASLAELLRPAPGTPGDAATTGARRDRAPERTRPESAAVSLVDLGSVGDGPLTVLLPDGTGTHGMFDPLVRALAGATSLALVTVADVQAFLDRTAEELPEWAAERYAEAIAASAPQRVRLVAYDLAGRAAVDTARLLLDGGVEVTDVVVVGDDATSWPETHGDAAYRMLAVSFGLAHEGTGLDLTAAGDDDVATVQRLADEAGWDGDVADVADVAGALPLYRHWLTSVTADRQDDQPYVGDLTVVRAGETDHDEVRGRWEEICLGEVRVVELPAAAPADLLRPPAVEDLADLLLTADSTQEGAR
ncbi:non-ribosomal peptide synthetase [Saccharomonospora xinjiangensis]|uniref:non-ribosomal peptide synthetase n=1 Tax=Saccharomonospora xinjiangensis TaxID=75294 RepID=UPI00106F491F|nr:non-ribosomal peptide synthetase [Saccharomonospora xinjiangensis]QBQ60758.1 Phenyloxazoline synthase MbtB [Saccharomonospora xinjiangensis]